MNEDQLGSIQALIVMIYSTDMRYRNLYPELKHMEDYKDYDKWLDNRSDSIRVGVINRNRKLEIDITIIL